MASFAPGVQGQHGVITAGTGRCGLAAPGAAVKVATCLAMAEHAGFELAAHSADLLVGVRLRTFHEGGRNTSGKPGWWY